MAERMTASWTTAPHFYLVREVNVSRLVTWRERASKQTGVRITYTDLLVKLVAAALVAAPAGERLVEGRRDRVSTPRSTSAWRSPSTTVSSSPSSIAPTR